MSLFFMHIPKTAGTTISSLLEDNLSLIDALIMKKIRNQFYANCVDYALLRSAKMVAGHLPLSVASLMDEPVSKMVFLRDPVTLSVSLFNHMKRTGEIAPDEDLIDFIESPGGTSITNVQVKWLANAIASNVPMHRPSLPYEFGWGDQLPELVVDEAMLSEAKANLEKFEFIGIFEEMERSISLMCEKFELSRGHHPVALNVGEYAINQGEQLTKLLQRHNQYDTELYQFARRCFDRASMVRHRKVFPRSDGELMPYMFIDMDEPIRHEGFHGREIWPHWHGVRWSSGSATIYSDCQITAGADYAWELLILATLSPTEMERLKLLICDVDLKYDLVQEGSAWFYRGIFSSQKNILRPTVKIIVPFAAEPSALGISGDRRELGVAVKAFKLMPVQSCALETLDATGRHR